MITNAAPSVQWNDNAIKTLEHVCIRPSPESK